METYLLVKFIHIVSAAVLFGTGAGIAFFMLKAYLSDNEEAMAITTRHVVLADWLFTAPAVVIQLVSGIWLTTRLSISYQSVWFVLVMVLFAFVGLCWIPVVRIQIRIRDIIARGGSRQEYRGLMKAWIGLGIPAFLAVLALYYLMVTKKGLGAEFFA